MTNAYEPPTAAPDAAPTAKMRPSVYRGGYSGVTALTLIAGIAVGSLISVGTFGMRAEVAREVATVLIYGAPALGWFCTLLALIGMLKGVHTSTGSMIFAAFALSIPAYILYIPVCTSTSMFISPGKGAGDILPSSSGIVTGSAVAFFAIVPICATILRWSFRVPVLEDAPIEKPDREPGPQQQATE